MMYRTICLFEIEEDAVPDSCLVQFEDDAVPDSPFVVYLSDTARILTVRFLCGVSRWRLLKFDCLCYVMEVTKIW